MRAHELGHGPAACAVVAALGERDATASGTDARQAVERLLSRRDAVGDRVRREAARLARVAGIAGATPRALDATGLVLALAYPDRVGRARPGSPGRFALTSGAGAAFDERDPLATQQWIAIADLDHRAGRADAQIRLAAPLDERDIDDALGALATQHDVVGWDDRSGDVVSRREIRVGAVVRTARPIDAGDAALDALLDGVRRHGLTLLARWRDADDLRARVALCRRVLGDDWPDLADGALLDTLESWLRPALAGARRRRDLDRLDVDAVLRDHLGWSLASRLDRLAPTHVTTPAGTRREIDYRGAEPALAVRLQELFGSATSPTVLDGRVPVVLHLLSPAGRPVQVTADLAGFWRGSYAQVRAELRGRYPKHHWPEDPASAEPSRGVRRRG